MKSPRCSPFLKTLLLIGSLAFCFGSLTVVKAGDSDPLFIAAGRPGALDHRTELTQGYLKVYSATDKVNDGGLAYYSHSSYAIYTIDGELFKSVENHISRKDESPELVALPAGSYLVIARSNRQGDVGISIAIKAGQLTVLDLDLREGTDTRSASRNSSRLADNRSVVRNFKPRRDSSISGKPA